jgi:hypothetical protein
VHLKHRFAISTPIVATCIAALLRLDPAAYAAGVWRALDCVESKHCYRRLRICL